MLDLFVGHLDKYLYLQYMILLLVSALMTMVLLTVFS